MNRDQIIGLLLIGAILVGYSYYMKPSDEEVEAAKIKRDSIELVRAEQQKTMMLQAEQQKNEANNTLPQIENDTPSNISAEVIESKLLKRFGEFANSATGDSDYIYIENDLVRLKIATKGGRVYSAELKEYQTHDSLPLILFDGDSTVFGIDFFTHENLAISTNNMFFVPQTSDKQINAESGVKSLSMRLMAGEDRYIEYVYTLEPGNYMVDFDINLVGMDEVLSPTHNYLDLNWEYYVPGQEKGRDFESTYSGVYYKYFEDEVDNLSETSDEDDEDVRTKLKWIAYKQQFFASALIADDYMLNASMKTVKQGENSKYLKFYSSSIGLPHTIKKNEQIGFKFYFGPNSFTTLKAYNLDLEELVPLGWGIFGWINQYAVIPIFNFLGSFISNYGIIILLLTIIIKLVLFPLTYKSYMSTAKMKVLKPQVEELTKKIPKDKSMERQQKSMELYKKAGVNPMGGCLPMALQMPILFAMFRFFPASIELRQKSFLWADDLSAYDSVLDLPWDIPFYGDHVSLFTLLMTISTIIYTRMNQSNMGDTQMAGMKTMMYMFPVMMLFWFNSYASGLSYYYFIANVITFSQMYFIKRFVNEEEILKKLEANKKKPTKKSGFQDRLEKMAKEKGFKAKK